jgi:hypothetical protein
MCVGKGGVHGEVTANEEQHPRYSILAALMKDMPRVVEATAVGA